MKTTHWTLVQHSGSFKPGFNRAVEEAAITREGDLERVLNAGGLIYTSYSEAADGAYKENYPTKVKGLYPSCNGTFIKKIRLGGRMLYIPASNILATSDDHPHVTNDPISKFRDARFKKKGKS
jgi:hypothetical protein